MTRQIEIWRKIARDNVKMGFEVLTKNLPEDDSLQYFNIALGALQNIPYIELSSDDWIILGRLQYCLGSKQSRIGNHQAALVALQTSLQSFEHVAPKEKLTSSEKIILFSIDVKVGEYLLNQNLEAAFFHFESALTHIQQVPRHDYSSLGADWKIIVNGLIYMVDKFQEYGIEDIDPNYIFTALNILLGIKNDPCTSLFIARCYQHSEVVAFPHTLEKELHSFAFQSMSPATPDFSREFLNKLNQFHLTVSAFSFCNQFSLQCQWLQLLQLIDNTVDQPDFPNVGIQTHLSNPVKRQAFRNKIKEMTKICGPLTLVDSIGHGSKPSVNMDVSIDELQSIYAQGHTAFAVKSATTNDNNALKIRHILN